MRLLAFCALALASPAAADPRPPPVAMTGPYAGIDDACAAAAAHVIATHVVDAKDVQCRVLDRTTSGVVLIVDYAMPSYASRWRDYTIALLHDGAWWLSATPSTLDLTGNAWGAGNCCYGRAGTPRYAMFEPPGFAIGLRTELHVWRAFRPGWGTGDAGSHKLVGDYLLCGERRGDVPACVRFQAAHCRVDQLPTLRLTASDVATGCAPP